MSEEKMIKHRVVLESCYAGADQEYEFEMPENATEEIEKEGYEVLISNLEWYVD